MIILSGLVTALFLVDEVRFLLVGKPLYFPLPLHGFRAGVIPLEIDDSA